MWKNIRLQNVSGKAWLFKCLNFLNMACNIITIGTDFYATCSCSPIHIFLCTVIVYSTMFLSQCKSHDQNSTLSLTDNFCHNLAKKKKNDIDKWKSMLNLCTCQLYDPPHEPRGRCVMVGSFTIKVWLRVPSFYSYGQSQYWRWGVSMSVTLHRCVTE